MPSAPPDRARPTRRAPAASRRAARHTASRGGVARHTAAREGEVLILRALGLGDLLTAVPALRGLARAFPSHRRLLAAPRALAPLLPLIGPDPCRAPAPAERAVHALIDLPAWVGGASAPDASLAERLPRPVIAVNLHGSGPQSHRLLLEAHPQRLIAFAHPEVPQSVGGPRWDTDVHEVARWCSLLSHFGIEADPGAIELPAPAPSPELSKALVADRAAPRRVPAKHSGALADRPGGGDAPCRDDGPTLLHPGAGSPARRWPAERWAQVARGERARGRNVLISGSATERPLARRIARDAELPAAAVLAGRLDLGGLAALLARAGRVVCGDTGVAHLASALRVPSVVIFGPTSPRRWGPPADRPWHRALWSGRAGDPHADVPDPGLLEIEPDQVLDALAQLPEPPRSRLAAAA